MVSFNRSPWEIANATLGLFRFVGGDHHRVVSRTPVLMLHGPMTNHRTWDTMAYALRTNGLTEIYGADIPDELITNPLQAQTLLYLERISGWLLENFDARTRLILIGHSTGGVLARGFLFKSELAERILYLFSLASPHHRTHFTHTVFVPNEEAELPADVKMVRTPHIPQNTYVVNMFGNAVGLDFDGAVRGVYLPEAVNVVLPLEHGDFKSHPSVIDEIMGFLQGRRYRIQLYLHGLHMRDADQDGRVGPFYFEVNGMRSPFDGVFQAQVEYQYTFDENNTPLAALDCPDDQTLTSLIFRLKDLSRARSTRRSLFAKLLVSLGDDVSAIHEMQDNQGSKIAVRVRTQRMPRVLDRNG